MARYSLIATDIWYDECFMNLDPQGKLLYFYLLTSPHCSNCGFYRLPLSIVEMETGASKLLLKDSHLWKYDEEKQVVLIPSYLKYNKMKSTPQKKALAATLSTLPNTKLIVEFFKGYIRNVDQDFSVFNNEILNRLRYQIQLRNDDVLNNIFNSILISKT